MAERNDEREGDRLERRWRRANATVFVTLLVWVALCVAIYLLLWW